MFTVSAFAIIFDESKRVLLCHRRDYDLWNLPGGRVEQGESPWEAAVRETKEEVGLQIEIEKISGIYSKPSKNEIVFSFLAKVVSGTMQHSEEVDEAKFFSVETLPTNTVPKQVERVQDAISSKEVVLKKQFGPSSIELLKTGKL